MPIRFLVIVCSCSAVAKAEPVLHRAHIRDCLAVPNRRLSFLGSVWEAVVLAKLGVRKQVSRSITIPKDDVISLPLITTLDACAEMQTDNRWSKCIVVSAWGKAALILH